MFTRYNGTAIPENYSGVRFREAAAHTEMKTHKPSPSYTSTKTSVSPTFKSVQLQRAQGDFENMSDKKQYNAQSDYGKEFKHEYESERMGIQGAYSLEGEKSGGEREGGQSARLERALPDTDASFAYRAQEEGEDGYATNDSDWDRSGGYYAENGDLREGVYEKRKKSNGENGATSYKSDGLHSAADAKNEQKHSDLKAELSGLLDKLPGGISSDDFILLAVIFLILGGDSDSSRSAVLPLALLLLYS